MRRPLFLVLLVLLPLSPPVARPDEAIQAASAPGDLAGRVGRAVYLSAAGIMRIRHRSKPHETLSAREKATLRPAFGTLVDRVRLVWGAEPIDRWGPLQVGETIGQTFGHTIYLAEPRPEEWTPEQLALVLHEMVHSRQFEELGSSHARFGYEYFRAWAQAGFAYAPNQLEVHARQDARHLLGEAWERYASRM